MDHYLFSDRSRTMSGTEYARHQMSKDFSITMPDGTHTSLNYSDLYAVVCWAGKGYENVINAHAIIEEALKNIFDRIPLDDIIQALVLGAVALIEQDPAYGYIAGRLLLRRLYRQVINAPLSSTDLIDAETYRRSFVSSIEMGIKASIFNPRLREFDCEYLAQHLVLERDDLFDYMGFRALYERYFAKIEDQRIEMPQSFWMRVAMGLCYNEVEKEKRAIEFYNLMSLMRYTPSTPTLLHSGHKRSQLSSCFLTTVSDDLHHIFKSFSDNAQMSKWSGGVANDWTPIRATGALVGSINTESQGVVPFLKITSDVTAAINRSGSRRGATVVYLETWHYEIEDFLDLRRNTGDERRRTHDINTANWIPDLFMQRVMANGAWILFSPDEVPDLHDLYGKKFKERYEDYERMAHAGKIKIFKILEAQTLWKKMLTRLFETGHPWITFKDSFNIRSPQDHAGVIHSTNLCTEISLNTSRDEIAVCNIGSLNLVRHMVDGQCDKELLKTTITTAMRMLDNVIDITFYPVEEGKNSNMRHRPVGLGLMGLQDALYEQNMTFDNPRAQEFSTDIMEFIAYHAILASSELAKERGTYTSYKGSKWDRDIFPQDTLALLAAERGEPIPIVKKEKLDWTPVRNHVRKHGMRNSNTMAIAPTATISTITGCFPCIEPIYKNIYVKSNMNGEFTVINKYLVEDLKKINLWDIQMINDLKFYDGNVRNITRIPLPLREKYKDVFDLDPVMLISLSALRGQWIDQSQSHNVFMKGVSGKLLNDIYMTAWKLGIKAMYYLRTLGASQIEKSTLDAGLYGFTQQRDNGDSEQKVRAATVCDLSTDPSCDSCQ